MNAEADMVAYVGPSLLGVVKAVLKRWPVLLVMGALGLLAGWCFSRNEALPLFVSRARLQILIDYQASWAARARGMINPELIRELATSNGMKVSPIELSVRANSSTGFVELNWYSSIPNQSRTHLSAALKRLVSGFQKIFTERTKREVHFLRQRQADCTDRLRRADEALAVLGRTGGSDKIDKHPLRWWRREALDAEALRRALNLRLLDGRIDELHGMKAITIIEEPKGETQIPPPYSKRSLVVAGLVAGLLLGALLSLIFAFVGRSMTAPPGSDTTSDES